MLRAGMATVAVAATGVVSGVASKGAEKLKPLREPLESRIEDLEQRFDELEHHHKNLIRVGGIAFALSTGIDVISFL